MSTLIGIYARWLRAGGRAPNTIRTRTRVLAQADGYLPLGIDRACAEELADFLGRDHLSAWTRHTYFGHLAGYYRWGVRTGNHDYDPTTELLAPPPGDRLPDPATDAEVAAALALLPAQPWGMAVRLAAYAGLRAHELAAVRREDCSVDVIRIRGKGGRWQTVPMHPHLWAVIGPRPAGPLVTSRSGAAVTGPALSGSQRRAWARIGQPHQHLHRFRHWYATTQLRLGADVRTVQENMRHASLQSTQGYTAVLPGQRNSAAARLPVLG